MTRVRMIRPEPGGKVPRTAMVMAAGLGKRMRPLTATRPKPLVEVAGKALLDHVFDRLKAAGVERAVVNVHILPMRCRRICSTAFRGSRSSSPTSAGG